mmetsp:Transcript_48839/g.81167  ORF Transcript_48839/g.81167 Transcript_48839/m.81167 type:complete len:415 (+) Transcript_48839:42-1286(+)
MHLFNTTSNVHVTTTDGLLLLPGPLRFVSTGICQMPAWSVEQRSHWLWQNSTGLRGSDGSQLVVTSSSIHSTLLKLCVAAGCAKCIGRGSANRAVVRPCALADFEEVQLTTCPALWHRQNADGVPWVCAVREAGCKASDAFTIALSAVRKFAPSAISPPHHRQTRRAGGTFAIALLLAGISGWWLARRRRARAKFVVVAELSEQLKAERARRTEIQHQARRLRQALREKRDLTLPIELLQRMRNGELMEAASFSLKQRSCAGELFSLAKQNGSLCPAWVQLTSDHSRLTVSESKASVDSPLYSIELRALLAINFGPAEAGEAMPWRTFVLVVDKGELSISGSSDEQAAAWVQGLQAVLQALGLLAEPLAPGTLIKLRVQMKLALHAMQLRQRRAHALTALLRQASASTGSAAAD